MAARTLKVIRRRDGFADALLFEASLAEPEGAELTTITRVADPTPETPEFRDLGPDEKAPEEATVYEDFVLVLELGASDPDVVRVYEAADGWRWRRVAANGEIVADSGEAYASKTGARKAAAEQRVKVQVGEAADDE